MEYGESCEECGDPEPGAVYVNESRTVCEACHERGDAGATANREFRFRQYGKAELFRAACKRRGVTATQDLDIVWVPGNDADRVRQLARRYGLRSIDGAPAP